MKLYYIANATVVHNIGPNTWTTSIVLQVFQSQVVGTPYMRIYKDGTAAPAWQACTAFGSVWQLTKTPITDFGLYVMEFKDDAHASGIQIGKIYGYQGGVSCDDLKTYALSLDPVGVHVAGLPSGVQASIDGGTTFKTTNQNGSCFWYNSEIAALGLTLKVNSIVVASGLCGNINAGVDLILDDTPPLVVTPIVTNTTTIGGNDGGILLDIQGGSGNFTFNWADGPTTQNRSGLVAATYTVTVTDLITGGIVVLPIIVSDPAIVPPQKGTFLTVPALNSLTFVIQQLIDQCINPQALDNVLFAEQYFEGVYQNEQNYFQRICKCDVFPTQFNSDYPLFEVTLRDFCTDAIVKQFPYELKEENIGATDDFAILLYNHTISGQTRVYFGIGAPPVPLVIGEGFEILNNAPFNGVYSIVDIQNDPARGYSYIVINKMFTGAAGQSATGRFSTTTADFNVFEAIHDFSDVPSGKYYVNIRAYDLSEDSPDINAISEPIDVQTEHKDTNIIRYKCIDNAFDMTWTTGYLGLLRIPSHFGNHRQPGGERSVTRDADYRLVKVNAKKSRIILMKTFSLPPYLHEKLSVVFDCDEITINGLICQTSEPYEPPGDDDYQMLTDSSVKVEVKWFASYNSDDIGSVQDGGYIKTETGFLKR